MIDITRMMWHEMENSKEEKFDLISLIWGYKAWEMKKAIDGKISTPTCVWFEQPKKIEWVVKVAKA